jgi:hypothetical protein
MRLLRMTTRRWMALVAVVATTLAFAQWWIERDNGNSRPADMTKPHGSPLRSLAPARVRDTLARVKGNASDHSARYHRRYHSQGRKPGMNVRQIGLA